MMLFPSLPQISFFFFFFPWRIHINLLGKILDVRNSADRELLLTDTFTPHHHLFFFLFDHHMSLVLAILLSPKLGNNWNTAARWFCFPGGEDSVIFLRRRNLFIGTLLFFFFLNKSIRCFLDATTLCQFVYLKIPFTSERLSFSWICQNKKMKWDRRREREKGRWKQEKKKKRTVMTYIKSYALYLLTDNWKSEGEILEYLNRGQDEANVVGAGLGEQAEVKCSRM